MASGKDDKHTKGDSLFQQWKRHHQESGTDGSTHTVMSMNAKLLHRRRILSEESEEKNTAECVQRQETDVPQSNGPQLEGRTLETKENEVASLVSGDVFLFDEELQAASEGRQETGGNPEEKDECCVRDLVVGGEKAPSEGRGNQSADGYDSDSGVFEFEMSGDGKKLPGVLQGLNRKAAPLRTRSEEKMVPFQ